MTVIQGKNWYYKTDSNLNWSVTTFDHTTNTQSFELLNDGHADLEIAQMPDSSDFTVLIQYFENDTAETKRKYWVWDDGV